MFNLWNQSVISQQGAGTALTNTTTATSLLNGQSKYTLPAQALQFIGQKLRVKASGRISTAATTPGTLTLDIRLGSVVAFTMGATGTLVTSAANLTWKFEADLTTYSVGSVTVATLYGVSEFKSFALSATVPLYLGPASSPAAGTGFDSTVANVVDFFGTWSVASASNIIRCDDFELVSLI